MLDMWKGLWPNCVACICNGWLNSICWESWDNTENQGSAWSLRGNSFDQPVTRYKKCRFSKMQAGGCFEHAGKGREGKGREGDVGRTPTLLFISLMLFSASLSLSLSLVNWTNEGQIETYTDRQSNSKAKSIAGKGKR